MRRLLTALLVLAASLPAAAADRCLTGDSALADRRALPALETALDATCPCAVATSCGTYQIGARGVARNAIAAETLRRECRSTAAALVRGTDCGSKAAPCGRFAARMPPATLTQAEAHALVVRWVIPFLQQYLAGRTDVAPLLSPAGASGVIVMRAL